MEQGRKGREERKKIGKINECSTRKKIRKTDACYIVPMFGCYSLDSFSTFFFSDS